MNDMLDRIDRLMDGVRGVSDSIAHDLRTPIARARAKLEEALGEQTDAEALRAAMEQGIADLDDITRVFEALLRIAEAEAGARRAAFAPLDLVPVLADVAEFYGAVAESGGQAIATDLPARLDVVGDRDLLAQAVGNLLDNALKFTPAGGTRAGQRARGRRASASRSSSRTPARACRRPIAPAPANASSAPMRRAARRAPGSGCRWCGRWRICMAATWCWRTLRRARPCRACARPSAWASHDRVVMARPPGREAGFAHAAPHGTPADPRAGAGRARPRRRGRSPSRASPPTARIIAANWRCAWRRCPARAANLPAAWPRTGCGCARPAIPGPAWRGCAGRSAPRGWSN